ncbi:unnamed protein product, partial [Penicillium discolor]
MAEYIRQLERTRDTWDSPDASGDAIAQAFERYLRRRGRRDHAQGEQHEQHAAKQDPVDHERHEAALRDPVHEERDHAERDDEGDPCRGHRVAEREEGRLAPALEQLVEAAAEHGRDRQQEGVAGGGGALIAEEQPHGDRAAGPRDAGDEGECLGESEGDAVRVGQIVQLPALGSHVIRDAQEDAEHDEHDRHDPERAEDGFDLVLEQESEQHDRDAADDDEPPHACVRVVPRHLSGEGPEPLGDDADDVAPEEHDDGGLRADLRDGGERRARVLPGGQERPHDPQMGAGGDRQELGETLDDSQDQCFEQVHGEAFVFRGGTERVDAAQDTGVVPPQRRHHRLDELPCERRLHADVTDHGLDPDVVAHDAPELREHVVLGPRDHADVDKRLGALRDDVVLVAGGESRRVGRRAERGPEEGLGRTGRGGEGVGVVGAPTAQRAQALEQRLRRRREPDRPPRPADGGDGLRELRDGVVLVQATAVPRPAGGDEADPDQRLLPHLQQVRPTVVHRDGVAADLADRGRRPGEPLRPVLHDERGALDPAVLLIGEERQDE